MISSGVSERATDIGSSKIDVSDVGPYVRQDFGVIAGSRLPNDSSANPQAAPLSRASRTEPPRGLSGSARCWAAFMMRESSWPR